MSREHRAQLVVVSIYQSKEVFTCAETVLLNLGLIGKWAHSGNFLSSPSSTYSISSCPIV